MRLAFLGGFWFVGFWLGVSEFGWTLEYRIGAQPEFGWVCRHFSWELQYFGWCACPNFGIAIKPLQIANSRPKIANKTVVFANKELKFANMV